MTQPSATRPVVDVDPVHRTLRLDRATFGTAAALLAFEPAGVDRAPRIEALSRAGALDRRGRLAGWIGPLVGAVLAATVRVDVRIFAAERIVDRSLWATPGSGALGHHHPDDTVTLSPSPPSLLAATVAGLVDLDPRRPGASSPDRPSEDLGRLVGHLLDGDNLGAAALVGRTELPVAELQILLAVLDGRRVTWQVRVHRSGAAPVAMTVVDGGPLGAWWSVPGRDCVRLAPTSPEAVWERLGALLSEVPPRPPMLAVDGPPVGGETAGSSASPLNRRPPETVPCPAPAPSPPISTATPPTRSTAA